MFRAEFGCLGFCGSAVAQKDAGGRVRISLSRVSGFFVEFSI